MARETEIVATSTGEHYLLIGLDESDTGTFSLQLYIEKTGVRAIDWLQSMSLSFISFMGGNLYLHNSSSADRCELFGERKDFKVGVVVNEQPNMVKLLDSIGIGTDGTWEVESLVIPADNNYPDGMSSVIPSGRFKKREGMLYSEFLRNQKTSGSTVKAIEAITGEPLRGREAYLILKNTSASKVQLWSVEINLTRSR